MDTLLYWLARSLVAFLQALPLIWVARLGRAGGALAYLLDRRHRRVALENLTACFQTENSPQQIGAVARENFRRIGENFACAVKTASMTDREILQRVEYAGGEHFGSANDAQDRRSRLIAIGHFGNFELYARGTIFVPGFQAATTYRALRQPSLNRLLQRLRTQSGCLFFERRTDGAALREALSHQRLMLGLLVDQHAGDRGLPAPFFGRECSTSAAPAVLALRYDCLLHSAICYRTGLGRWRFEVGPEIPTRKGGEARPLTAIAADINRAFETAIRRDPANWFWVHRRWKPVRRRVKSESSAPAVDGPVECPTQASVDPEV